MFLLLIQSLLTVGKLTKCWMAAFPIRKELTPCLLCHLFTSHQCTGEELHWGVGKLPGLAVVFNCLNASNVKSMCWQASGFQSCNYCSVDSPFQLAQLFWLACFPCCCSRGNLLLSRQAAAGYFSYLFLNCSVLNIWSRWLKEGETPWPC